MRLSLLFVCMVSLCSASEDSNSKLEEIASTTYDITTLFKSIKAMNQKIDLLPIYKDPKTGLPKKSISGSDMSFYAVLMNKKVTLKVELTRLQWEVKKYKNQVKCQSLITIDLLEPIEGFKKLLIDTQSLQDEIQKQLIQQQETRSFYRSCSDRTTSITSSEGSL